MNVWAAYSKNSFKRIFKVFCSFLISDVHSTYLSELTLVLDNLNCVFSPIRNIYLKLLPQKNIKYILKNNPGKRFCNLKPMLKGN